MRISIANLANPHGRKYSKAFREAEDLQHGIYDSFTAKYGIINSRTNRAAFGTDSSFFLLSSLEVLDDEGNFLRKADMFSKRTIKQRLEITHVDTSSEALAVSLAEKAKVDMDYMMELSNRTEEEICKLELLLFHEIGIDSFSRLSSSNACIDQAI